MKIKLIGLKEPTALAADEIMLGNIIQSGNNGKYVEEGTIGRVLQIGALDQEFEQVYCECGESFEWFFKDNYFGVPMSDFWFEVFGFTLETESAPGIGEFSWWENDRVVINNIYRGVWSIDGCSTPIRWVHQFQNAYFTFTGEKLLRSNLNSLC